MAPRKDYAERRAQSSGIGESKTFAALEGTFPEEGDGVELTLSGKPIPAELRHAVPYANTDQGIEEARQRAIAANGDVRPAKVELVRDAADKGTFDRYEGDLQDRIPGRAQMEREGLDLSKYLDLPKDGATVDPLGVEMQKHLRPGQRGLWMSKRVMDSMHGTRRGVLTYEVVTTTDAKGRNIPVEKSGMVLGWVPEEAAQQAARYYAELQTQAQRRAEDDVNEQRQRLVDDKTVRNLAGSDALKGFQAEDPELAARDIEFIPE